MALELGLRPLAWERYQPVEILAMRDARERRRRRDIGALALGLAGVMNRIPFNTKAVKPEDLAAGMAAAEYVDDGAGDGW